VIICRTPLRVSLFGGGTDYPVWYRDHGGRVISFTINKYSYITLRKLPPFFDYRYRIRYFKTEEVVSRDEIAHPVVREVLKQFNIDTPLEIIHTADLPARSGLGSSSTFSVGFLHALQTFKHYVPTKRELALQAIDLEQNVLKESVGSQDQVAASFGGLNLITFGGQSEFKVDPMVISSERLKQIESHLLLCFTGFSRVASGIAAHQIQNTPSKHEELHAMASILDKALHAMTQTKFSVQELGDLLDEQWQIKRKMSTQISNRKLDEIYLDAISSGASGGKLLGAGGGGFFLFLADPSKHDAIKANLSQYMFVPVRMESSGSTVIYFTHD
jgi:D-glycero-alpha-D-manno-heptose-7-phosphate kinase